MKPVMRVLLLVGLAVALSVGGETPAQTPKPGPTDISGTWRTKELPAIEIKIVKVGDLFKAAIIRSAWKGKDNGFFLKDMREMFVVSATGPTTFKGTMPLDWSTAQIPCRNIANTGGIELTLKNATLVASLRYTPTHTLTPTGMVCTGLSAIAVPLTFYPSGRRIVEADLDFERRTQRRIDFVKALALDLAGRRTALGSRLEAGTKALEQLAVAMDRHQSRIDALAKLLAALGKDVAVIQKEEEATPGVKELLDNEATLEAAIDLLVGQIAQARSAGQKTAALDAKLSAARRGLDALDDQIRSRLAGTPAAATLDRFLVRYRALQSQMAGLIEARASLLGEAKQQDGDLTRMRDEVRDVDVRLANAVRYATLVEPEITEVAATADGVPVFHAKVGTSFTSLAELDETIKAQQTVIAKLEGIKREAASYFFLAGRASVLSGAQLYRVQEKVRLAKGLVDVVYDGYDLYKAAASGGIIGAVSEGTKKYIEKKLLPSADLPVAPGSPEDLVNKMYSAGLKDAWGPVPIARQLVLRTAKDTIGKGAKETFNRWIGSFIYSKLEYNIRFRFGVERLRALATPTAHERAAAALELMAKQLKGLSKGYFESIATKELKTVRLKGGLAQIVESLIKDLSKAYIKHKLNEKEVEAWANFYTALVVEKAYYPFYYAAASELEDANLALDDMLNQKASLLAHVKPQGRFQTDLSAVFSDEAKVLVTLRLAGADNPKDPFEVSIGNIPAFPTANPNTYGFFSLTGAQPLPRGGFAVVLR